MELITFGHVWGTENKLQEEIRKSNGRIVYKGIVNDEELLCLYSEATFSCFVSVYEGFGFPIAESLWLGTPVLTANFGSMKEVARYGGCHLVDTADESALYDGLERMILDEQLILRLQEEIQAAPFETWSDYAAKVYDEVFG